MKDSDGAVRYRSLLDLVVETSLVLGSDLELPTLLAKLVALAERTLGAELSSVMLLDERRQELHWEIADGGLATGVLRQMTVAVGRVSPERWRPPASRSSSPTPSTIPASPGGWTPHWSTNRDQEVT